MARLSVLTVLASLLVPSSADAETAPVLAIFDLRTERVRLSRAARQALGDYLAAGLAARGYRVVPREQLRSRLRKQKRASYKGCYDRSCQIEIGRELAAQMLLTTRVSRLGRRCLVTASLYELRSATAQRGATAEGGCTEQAILGSLKSIIEQLSATAPARPGAASASGVELIETGAARRTLRANFDGRRFDALGYLTRARALARKVFADARLVDFDVQGVFPDGHVDLTLQPDFRANYAFRSPSRSKRPRGLPANVTRERRCLVHVEVSAKQVEVYSTTSERCDEKWRGPWRCSLARAFQLARARGAPRGNLVAKVSWLWDGWYFDFGQTSLSVADSCR